MADVNAGRVLIMPVGAWNSATAYAKLDLVTYQNESWLCRQACTGVTPTAQATTYWQKFGSAVSIANTNTAGIVRPDGSSIKIIADGTISVPTATGEALGLVKPDGTTITIDANGALTAQAAGALSDLTDVNITSATQGQILQYNVTSHKWENVTKQFLTELEQMADVDIDDSTLADGQALIYDVATGKWQNKAFAQYPKLDTVEQVMANNQSGKVADALTIKEINTNLTQSINNIGSNYTQSSKTINVPTSRTVVQSFSNLSAGKYIVNASLDAPTGHLAYLYFSVSGSVFSRGGGSAQPNISSIIEVADNAQIDIEVASNTASTGRMLYYSLIKLI